MIHIKKNKGFTLIELLVVIAIIGLLSSIILAAMNGAKKQAQFSSLIQEFHQIQNAIELYRTDNNGDIPKYTTPPEINTLIIRLSTGNYIPNFDITKTIGNAFTILYYPANPYMTAHGKCGSHPWKDYAIVTNTATGGSYQDYSFIGNFMGPLTVDGLPQPSLGDYCITTN